MGKRLWINVGLLGLVILLTLLMLNSEEETDQQVTTRLSNINPDEIVQIKVTRKNLDDFEFNKQNEVWMLNSPQQYRANNARINAMLKLLDSESFAQLNPDQVDMTQLGLADPVVKLKLNDYEFSFGYTDAIDQRRYVLFNNKIHLTNDFLYQQLMANAAFFAEPKLLTESFEINLIEYPENRLKQVNNHWQLETVMDINPDQLSKIIFNWQNAAAISVSKYKPTGSEPLIKLSTSNNESILFFIVATEPHLVLGRKDLGIQYHMASDATNKLLLVENAGIIEETEPSVLELQ